MTDQNQGLRDDIAFLRNLAESGRDRPMPGGSILLTAGLVFGLASLLVWYLSAILGLGGAIYAGVWGVTGVIYAIALTILLRRLPKTAGAAQAANGIVWSAMGMAIFFIGLSLWLVADRLHRPEVMFAFPSILMAVYGACWWVGALLLRQSWLRLVAFAAFAMALVNAWFASGAVIWLIYGISLLALLAAPGFVLMRQAHKAG